MTSKSAVSGPRRMDSIDALRGFACLWVLLFHTFEAHPVPSGIIYFPLRFLIGFSNIGWLGVSLFLVLSGFCLYYPLVCKNSVPDIRINIGQFLIKRAYRILPPYYISLILSLLLNARSLHQHGKSLSLLVANGLDIPLHLVMLHNLTVATVSSISPVCWSLALEWQLYLVFPIIIWFSAKYGLRFILFFTLLVAILWQFLIYIRLGSSFQWNPLLTATYHSLPGRLFEFVAGMMAAALVARPNFSQRRVMILVGSFCFVPALYIVLFRYRFGPLCDQLWGVVFSCGLAVLGNVRNDLLAHYRLARALIYLGVRSYSVYLVHLLVLFVLPMPKSSANFQEIVFFIGSFLKIGVAILVGLAFYRIAEYPFMARKIGVAYEK